MKNNHVVKILIVLLFFLLIAALPKKTTVYMIGDSTMAPKKENKRPETGWGEKLPSFFNGKISFVNKARNGRSTRTFIEEERWDTVYNALSEDDYVFIQFGHNDQSKNKVDRYTPPEDYKNNLIKFVKETRSKKAVPFLLTSIVRRRFDEQGKFYDVHGVYPDIVRKVADEYDVLLIDHHKASEKILIEFGEEKSKELFLHLAPGENENYPEGLEDNTHFSPTGAEVMAELAVKIINKLSVDLSTFIVE